MIVLLVTISKEVVLKPKSRNWSWDSYTVMIKTKEKRTVLFIGNLWVHKFSDSDWLQHIYKGSNKTRLQYCKKCQDVLLYIRAIQGHTGGKVIAPELMGHVAVPSKSKEFLFHRGCSYDVT